MRDSTVFPKFDLFLVVNTQTWMLHDIQISHLRSLLVEISSLESETPDLIIFKEGRIRSLSVDISSL